VRIPGTVLANQSANEKLSGVQAARGIAALMVVAYHATRSLSLPQYLGHVPFGNALGFGHAGVDFFFVLSGFIITHAHARDIGQPQRLNRYLWRRVTRIYPIYWFVTGMTCLQAVFSADAATRLAPFHLLNSFLLLPEDNWPLVSVAWTLESEMLFYGVFAFAILSRACCKPLVIAAVALVAVGIIATSASPWFNLFTSPFNILFLMGIGAARFLANHRVPQPAMFVVGGIGFFLAVGVLEVLGVVPLNGLIGRALYGSGSLAILLGLVESERSGSFHRAIGGLIGDSSYCLYLFHLTIVTISVRICGQLGFLTALPATVVVALLILGSVVAALMLHLWVELPMMRFIRRRAPRAWHQPVPVAPTRAYRIL
jgi:exopolysaccharide production protein ExoZ